MTKDFHIVAWCNYCNGKIEVTKPKQFETCKCGKSFLDAGDEYYSRAGGSLRNTEEKE